MICDRHFSSDETKHFVTDIVSKLSSKFGAGNSEIYFDDSSDNGFTLYDAFHPVGSIGYKPMLVSVGMCRALAEADKGILRDFDFVWCIQQAFHESYHIWQYAVGYRRYDVSANLKDQAKEYAIGSFVPEYNKSAYSCAANELSADQYAVLQTKSFFDRMSETDERFCDVNVDRIICENEFNRRGAVYRHLSSCKTVVDVASVYSKAIAVSPYQRKFNIEGIKNIVSEKTWSRGFKEILRNEKLCNSLLNSSSGLEETELLCHYIGEHHPEHFRGLLCIRDEYCHGIGSKTMSKLLRVTEAEPVEPGPDGPEIL